MADLITLEEYKSYKGINSPSNDEKIEEIIVRASEFIKRFTNKTFIDYSGIDKVEFHDALDANGVLLEELPIISVTYVKTSTDGGVTQTTLVENIDYFVDKTTSKIISKDTFTSSGIGFHSFEVSYKGGYLDTPEDIKQATMDLVAYYVDQEYTPKRQFGSNTVENFNFRAASDVGLPGHIQRILAYYREP